MPEERKRIFDLLENEIFELLGWIFWNVLLPLVPLGIKIIICIFSKDKISIIDSIELILYSFILCINLINILSQKKSIAARIFFGLLFTVCGIDLIILSLMYSGNGNYFSNIYALCVAVIMPILAIGYKCSEIKERRKH